MTLEDLQADLRATWHAFRSPQAIDRQHAEALAEHAFRGLSPDDTVPSVEAIIAAESVTDFALVR